MRIDSAMLQVLKMQLEGIRSKMYKQRPIRIYIYKSAAPTPETGPHEERPEYYRGCQIKTMTVISSVRIVVHGDGCPDLWFESDPLRRLVAREPRNLLRRQHFSGVTGNTKS